MEMPTIAINYSTQKRTPSLFPSLTFYYNMAKVVFIADRVAKKGKYFTEVWVNDSLKIIQAVEKAGGQVCVEGMENFMNLDKPCVFVANHMSTLETFCLPILIQPLKDVTYIVKSDLATYPFFGSVMRSRSPILLERKNPREDFAKSMREGVEILESGRSLIIFPQGTRTKVFAEQDFNSLGAKLAKKANVPLVPIALKTDFWGIGKIIKDFGKVDVKKVVHFSFGKAMDITGNGKDEHQYCVDFIKNNLIKWTEEEAQ